MRIAFDYLAYVRFEDVPRSTQVQALFLVEDARSAYDRRSVPVLARRFRFIWQRVRSWLADAMNRWGELYERSGAGPFGGPLLPV